MLNLLKRNTDEILPPPPPIETIEEYNFEKVIDSQDRVPPLAHIEAEEEVGEVISKIEENTSFLKRIFKSKEQVQVENLQIKLTPEIDGILAVNQLIRLTRESILDSNFENAKKFYIQANGLYNQLSAQDQTRVYHEMSSLYEERIAAKELGII